MDVNSNNVVIIFDQQGVLTGYSSSSSQLGAGTGMVSGAQQGAASNAAQPLAAKP
jgi:hypothetical protein